MRETPSVPTRLDRYTTMGELSLNVRRIFKRTMFPASAVLAACALFLAATHSPGALAFAMMAAGALLALHVWADSGLGVPLMPMLVVQQLVVNAAPILSRHEVVTYYPAAYVTSAGLEVFAFCLALAGAWRLGMNVFSPASPLASALVGVDRGGIAGLSRLGFGLAGSATAFLALQSLNLISFLFEILPAGSYPIIGAVTAVASGCGFFLLAMILGSGEMRRGTQIAFWSLMAANCLISASSLLLSSAFGVIAAIVIGLFWSSGRIPWKFIALTMTLISFLNVGKYGMRDHYWRSLDEDQNRLTVTFATMPNFYSEWAQSSFNSLTAEAVDPHLLADPRAKKVADQGLFQRLNNLQNLLYVIDAMEQSHIPPLEGETYIIIPPLLIPRLFWPDKPRSHEGQIILNVHFGRQLLESTFTTYVAWGLLAEAYGNFGPIKGVLLIGAVLGFFFAWAENFTTRKPLLSTEGFVAFVVFLGLANSYEMVASVMVTTIFQSVAPVIIACSPFVRRKVVVRPTA